MHVCSSNFVVRPWHTRALIIVHINIREVFQYKVCILASLPSAPHNFDRWWDRCTVGTSILQTPMQSLLYARWTTSLTSALYHYMYLLLKPSHNFAFEFFSRMHCLSAFDYFPTSCCTRFKCLLTVFNEITVGGSQNGVSHRSIHLPESAPLWNVVANNFVAKPQSIDAI